MAEDRMARETVRKVPIHPDEWIEDLGHGGLRLILGPGAFPVSTDSILLSDFATIKDRERVIDLGTGTGLIPLLLSAKTKAAQIVGIELDPRLADMARRSVKLNGLEDRISVIAGDIRGSSRQLGQGSFDIVISNPPYLPLDGSPMSQGEEAAKWETQCSLKELIREAGALVRYGGRVALVVRPDRMPEVIFEMRSTGISPKRALFVHPRPGADASLVLLEGARGGGPGFEVLEPLVLCDVTGEPTPQVRRIYEEESVRPPGGALYVCGTPIGNLRDVTLRALDVLRSVDLICAEDTRRTRKLLNHYRIHKPLLSYHEHNKEQRAGKIIEEIMTGRKVALVTDAGMPGISDPGADLICLAIERGLPVIPIPGPTAAVTALVVSGIPSDEVVFLGFLPRAGKARREALDSLRGESRTMVLYEAPHRLTATLEELAAALGGTRRAALARELTKLHEEVIRGSLDEILGIVSAKPPKGEMTLVIEGLGAKEKPAEESQIANPAGPGPVERVLELVSSGINKKEAIKQVAGEFRIPRRELYMRVVRMANANEPGED